MSKWQMIWIILTLLILFIGVVYYGVKTLGV